MYFTKLLAFLQYSAELSVYFAVISSFFFFPSLQTDFPVLSQIHKTSVFIFSVVNNNNFMSPLWTMWITWCISHFIKLFRFFIVDNFSFPASFPYISGILHFLFLCILYNFYFVNIISKIFQSLKVSIKHCTIETHPAMTLYKSVPESNIPERLLFL